MKQTSLIASLAVSAMLCCCTSSNNDYTPFEIGMSESEFKTVATKIKADTISHSDYSCFESDFNKGMIIEIDACYSYDHNVKYGNLKCDKLNVFFDGQGNLMRYWYAIPKNDIIKVHDALSSKYGEPQIILGVPIWKYDSNQIDIFPYEEDGIITIRRQGWESSREYKKR